MLFIPLETNAPDHPDIDPQPKSSPQSFGVITAQPAFDDLYPQGAHPDVQPVAVAAFMVLGDTQVGWGFHAAFTQWFGEMRDAHLAEGVELKFEEWICGAARSALNLPAAAEATS